MHARFPRIRCSSERFRHSRKSFAFGRKPFVRRWTTHTRERARGGSSAHRRISPRCRFQCVRDDATTVDVRSQYGEQEQRADGAKHEMTGGLVDDKVDAVVCHRRLNTRTHARTHAPSGIA